MDALALLQEVSTAYRILHTLSLEATIIRESGDENDKSRYLQRIRFFYTHPNLLRFEPLGKNGTEQISDGQHLHTIHRQGPHFPGVPQNSTTPLAEVPHLPHSFRSDLPQANALLFQNIDQHVTTAEILRQEDGCHVVSVTYEPPARTKMMTKGSLFWIDPSTHMVMRSQDEIGHRRPAEDEITWIRHSLSVQQIRVNEPIPPETFQCTEPATESAPRPREGRLGFGIGSGAGSIRIDPTNPQKSVERSSSHHWDGDTHVEISKWKLHGKTLTFERRLTFSDNDSNLTVDEHITGPAGDHQNRYTLEV